MQDGCKDPSFCHYDERKQVCSKEAVCVSENPKTDFDDENMILTCHVNAKHGERGQRGRESYPHNARHVRGEPDKPRADRNFRIPTAEEINRIGEDRQPHAVQLGDERLYTAVTGVCEIDAETTRSDKNLNKYHVKALEAVGLSRDEARPENADKAYKQLVASFDGTAADIAKLIVLAKVHKNPAYTFPIFTGVKYIGHSLSIDEKRSGNSTDRICKSLIYHSALLFRDAMLGTLTQVKDIENDYNNLRKNNNGLVCNTVSEMMSRLALTNTPPEQVHDDASGTIDFIAHNDNGYRFPDIETKKKLEASNFDNI